MSFRFRQAAKSCYVIHRKKNTLIVFYQAFVFSA